MQMLVPIVIGVAILIAFVALYMSRANWRVYHIVAGVLLLIANAFFLYLAARMLHAQREWQNTAKKWEEAYAQQYDFHRVLTGELDGKGEVIVDRDQKTAQDVRWTIDDWKSELAEATYGRGRVLTGLVPRLDPQTGILTGQVPQPQQRPIGLTKDSTVYVFQSTIPRPRKRLYSPAGTEVAIMNPEIVRFVGAYIVNNVTDQAVELRPLHPEQPVEQPNGPLVIYEVPPVDTHLALEHLKADDPKITAAAIGGLFPQGFPAEVVEQYLRDGQPVEDAAEGDPNVWLRVRFTKEYTSEAAEKAEPVAGPPPAVAPDPNAPPALEDAGPASRRPIKFAAGDEALLPPYVAEELVSTKGVAEYVKTNKEEGIYSHVYRRPLNNYPLAFRDIRARFLETNIKTAEVDRQIAAIQKSIELAKDSERLRKEEAGRLAQDLEKFTFEAATVKEFHDELTESVKRATEEIESLKRSIDQQAAEYAKLQLAAAEAIDRRTTATASTR